ncbi:Eco57I restriction-modification methylase domain-containing protein [Paenibacillus riograndensis]|uniref:site-specific DNA-methyltransferase (adenine-specific) n=1 Tax=Paenibacillus riograndensis SBR5 TaxID=1073571 RepID=A0A0E4CUP7_9BACL|nr:N-6 DNA methylase [Paenibacillus riograndensis]CQR52553.1 site-specific DNA-methyltransferase restriction-modification protein [Paenibacillus riograndensis SBR5]
MIEKCQIFTPEINVKELLDAANYTNNLYGKKVIENACGDGNILKEIVKRYIKDCLKNMINIIEIKKGLEHDIYGTEIDKVHFAKCLENLDGIAEFYGIYDVKWNIFNQDFLKMNLRDTFDFVIGNPPYITYRDLDEETRTFLKEHFRSCRYGKFDYCYAFIEASLTCLNSTGKLAYLIPSSIFKNVFGQELRNMIVFNTVKIIDYTTRKLFEQALTSSAILLCDKGKVNDDIEYLDVVNNITHSIPKKSLMGKWIFGGYSQNSASKRRFGEYFTAAISIATLFNKAYLLKNYIEEEEYINIGGYKIERSATRVAVSPKSLNYKKRELIIFPYYYNNDTLIRYKTEEFELKFPETSKYLKSYLKELANRNSDDKNEWFEYGRSQALAHLNQHKLLLSTIVTNEIKVYDLPKDFIPYSGIYIVSKKRIPLLKAKEILESESFYNYVKGIGISANGNSLRITASDINNYEF